MWFSRGRRCEQRIAMFGSASAAQVNMMVWEQDQKAGGRVKNHKKKKSIKKIWGNAARFKSKQTEVCVGEVSWWEMSRSGRRRRREDGGQDEWRRVGLLRGNKRTERKFKRTGLAGQEEGRKEIRETNQRNESEKRIREIRGKGGEGGDMAPLTSPLSLSVPFVWLIVTHCTHSCLSVCCSRRSLPDWNTSSLSGMQTTT